MDVLDEKNECEEGDDSERGAVAEQLFRWLMPLNSLALIRWHHVQTHG